MVEVGIEIIALRRFVYLQTEEGLAGVQVHCGAETLAGFCYGTHFKYGGLPVAFLGSAHSRLSFLHHDGGKHVGMGCYEGFQGSGKFLRRNACRQLVQRGLLVISVFGPEALAGQIDAELGL